MRSAEKRVWRSHAFASPYRWRERLWDGNDTLPSGNVDVAPTVAALLGLSLPQADGRPLLEALASSAAGTGAGSYSVANGTLSTSVVTGVPFQALTDPSGATLDSTLTGSYGATMHTKTLTDPSGNTLTYFDYVKVSRQ